MEDAIIVGIVFFSIVAVVKIIADAATRRRLLEKAAADPQAVQHLSLHPELANLSSLKWGMVLIGIGLAWMISLWMPHYWHEETMFGLMFLLAGIGMLAYYPIAQRKIKKIEQQGRSLPPTR
ncbi:MAG: DUF6249 domain-containing protein [candidate division Zixibacteria bacterium]|nr:DUF6249 domain-containing protein [candidate division Zixibacteria bacterium]